MGSVTEEPTVMLRDVRIDDVDAYVRMRCDPVMMAELGGPMPADGMAAKVARDVRTAESGAGWVKMIVPDENDPSTVAGAVNLWSDGSLSEIGWMVLPEFQGRGLAKAAAGMLLEQARADGRWGVVHAHPGVTNAASNGICRSLGFTLLGEVDVEFGDRLLHCHHWTITT